MVQVAAAIIQRDGKILICRRGAGGNTAYLWEFPGGKREAGETLSECAVRECFEELDVVIQTNELFDTAEYEYPDRKIHFTFFTAELLSGEPVANVHVEIRWVLPEELPNFDFCPADVGVVEKCRAQRA